MAPSAGVPEDGVEGFARSLIAWLYARGYTVGFTGRTIDCPRLVTWAKSEVSDVDRVLAPAGVYGKATAALLGLLVGTMTGGATAEQVTERLRPFERDVDLLGFQVVSSAAWVHPVLFADDIPVENLADYVETYAGYCGRLKDLVVHGFFAQTPTVDCDALFVYFDSDNAARAMSSRADLYFDRRMVRVRGLIVDVGAKTVVEPRADSMSGMLRQTLGTDTGDFDTKALRSVLLPPRRPGLDLG